MSQLVSYISAYWLHLTALLLTIITVLSLAPISAPEPIDNIDKLKHMMAYMALAVPGALAKPKYWIQLMVFFITYGIAIEYIQPYFNRIADIADVIANTLGVASAIITAQLWKHRPGQPG